MQLTNERVIDALNTHRGNVTQTAKALDVARTTLRDFIARNDIPVNKTRPTAVVDQQEIYLDPEMQFSSPGQVMEYLDLDENEYNVEKITFSHRVLRDGNKAILNIAFKKRERTAAEVIASISSQKVVYGRRKKPSIRTDRDHKVAIIAADFHATHGVDWELHDTALRIYNELRPDRFIVLGDLLDFNSLSRFAKTDPRWVSGLDEDVYTGRTILKDISESVPDETEKELVDGNHDKYLENWLLNDAPLGAANLDVFQMENILKLNEFGFERTTSEEGPSYPYTTVEIIPDVLVAIHGETTGKGAGNAVRKVIEKYGMSVVMAHVHRYAAILHRIGDVDHYGFECPSMAKPDLGYAKKPDHSQGFLVFNYWKDGSFTHEHAKWDRSKKQLILRDKIWKYKGA